MFSQALHSRSLRRSSEVLHSESLVKFKMASNAVNKHVFLSYFSYFHTLFTSETGMWSDIWEELMLFWNLRVVFRAVWEGSEEKMCEKLDLGNILGSGKGKSPTHIMSFFFYLSLAFLSVVIFLAVVFDFLKTFVILCLLCLLLFLHTQFLSSHFNLQSCVKVSVFRKWFKLFVMAFELLHILLCNFPFLIVFLMEVEKLVIDCTVKIKKVHGFHLKSWERRKEFHWKFIHILC